MKSQQRKGAAGGRELAAILRDYGYDAARGGSMTFGLVPDVIGLPGVHIEVKRVERLNVSEAMRQSVQDSQKFSDGIPAVFHRKNREGWLVTLRLSDFMEIYNDAFRQLEEGQK